MKNGILLGLDASSSEIGICLWDKDKNCLVDVTHITLKESDILKKGDEFKNFLIALIKKHPTINEIAIEQAYVAVYGASSSSAYTTALLNQVNAIYRYICYQQGLTVSTITVSDSRKFAYPKVKLQSKTKAGISQKEQIFTHVMEEFGDKLFPTKVISKGKRKGLTVFEDFCLDMSDSIVVAKGHYNKAYGSK